MKSLQSHDFVRTAGMTEFKELIEIDGLSTILGFQRVKAAPQYFVTLDNRLLAFAMDYFIAFFIFGILTFTYLLISSPSAGRNLFILASSPLIIGIKFIGTVLAEGSSWGATPGKKIIGAVVVKINGEPIGLGTAFVRNLAKVLGFLSLGIGFFTGFFDKRQQCWHDKITNTCVAKKRLI